MKLFQLFAVGCLMTFSGPLIAKPPVAPVPDLKTQRIYQAKIRETTAAFERLEGANPRDETSSFRIVVILALQGKYDDARKRAAKLLHPGQTADYLLCQRIHRIRLGQIERRRPLDKTRRNLFSC